MSAKEILKKYKIEINKHDFNLLEPLISTDCVFWFSSGSHHGLAQARKAFEKTWAAILEEVYSISDVQWIAESDHAAVCIYTFHWSGLVNGQKREGKGRGTSCFRREQDEWKIVHEHLSAMV